MLSAGKRLYKFALLSALAAQLLVGFGSSQGVLARDNTVAVEASTGSSIGISRAELPAPARATEQLIRKGGPFPYAKDGSVFGNRERMLPTRARGYYREYTVPTIGVRNRGGRRIVCGGKVMANPDSCYYTDDHYANFRLIVQ